MIAAQATARRARLLCACGIEDSACMVESQVDGDCSAHDARLAAKPTGYWGVGTDGERAWEVGDQREPDADDRDAQEAF